MCYLGELVGIMGLLLDSCGDEEVFGEEEAVPLLGPQFTPLSWCPLLLHLVKYACGGTSHVTACHVIGQVTWVATKLWDMEPI